MPPPDTLTIKRPDDWHLHLREDALLQAVLPYSSAVFKRALVMPNLTKPITTVEAAMGYRQNILSRLSKKKDPIKNSIANDVSSGFEPFMALYLTPTTEVEEVQKARENNFVLGFKYYPKGATTHSMAGVEKATDVYALFEEMEEMGVPLMVHGESVNAGVDIFDREKVFIDTVLNPIVEKFSNLKITLEHITTKEAVDFILAHDNLINGTHRLAGSVTLHHLMLNRNDLFTDGIRPHHFCYPILKREEHRLSLIKAIASGSKQFFLGTDSAPHRVSDKESACGCAGIFTAPVALSLYAEIFAKCNMLSLLENFCSTNGANFYGLPLNTEKVVMVKKEIRAPSIIKVDGQSSIIPFRAGQTLMYQVQLIE